MIVGVPAEIKTEEYRIAITPEFAAELTSRGYAVKVESGAGNGSSISDDELRAAGAKIVPDAAAVFEGSELILKVKEPQLGEVEMLSEGQTLFTFLHLAAYPKQAEALVASGATAIAYETVQLPNGELPMLTPMSEIAGRMAAQAGANYMERPHGGRGVLIGGATGVPPANVTVVGAGNAGKHAAMVAAGMGASVTVLDINPAPLREIDEMRLGRVVTAQSSKAALDYYVPQSDLLVGAVLVAGARAPVVVTAEHIKMMRPGSVVVDISIDQGGCIETARETTTSAPTGRSPAWRERATPCENSLAPKNVRPRQFTFRSPTANTRSPSRLSLASRIAARRTLPSCTKPRPAPSRCSMEDDASAASAPGRTGSG